MQDSLMAQCGSQYTHQLLAAVINESEASQHIVNPMTNICLHVSGCDAAETCMKHLNNLNPVKKSVRV